MIHSAEIAIAKYLKKTGETRELFEQTLEHHLSTPGSLIFMNKDAILLCTIVNNFVLIWLGYGDWFNKLRPMAVKYARNNGLNRLRWASFRKGMKRRAERLGLNVLSENNEDGHVIIEEVL